MHRGFDLEDGVDRHEQNQEEAQHLVQGSGFRVQGPGFRVQDSGFRVKRSRFRVQSFGFREQG